MRHIKITGFATAAIFLMFLTACGGGGGDGSAPPPGSSPNPSTPLPPVTIDITPRETSVKLGGTAAFDVTTNFTLSVVPSGSSSGCAAGAGNTVTCAPTETGVYEITVTAAADNTKKTTAKMTVMNITEIEPPPGKGVTYNAPLGMNNSGQIILERRDYGEKWKSCLYDHDSETCIPIEPPDAAPNADVNVFGINDSGDILGRYDKGYFLKTGGEYKLLDEHPDWNYTYYIGLNNEGQLVGWYTDLNGGNHGFLYDAQSGEYIPIDHNDAKTDCATGLCGTFLTGLNNKGQLAGYYTDAESYYHGFIYDVYAERFISIEHPGASPGSRISVYINGINDSGRVAGWFYDNDGWARGFVYDPDGDRFITITHPDAAADKGGTYMMGITNAGQAIGWYDDGGAIWGFLLENMF